VHIPPILGHLEQLTTLEVDGNSLATLPYELSRLQNLATLSCQSNQLADFPHVIEGLSRLKDLNLRSNFLETLPSKINALRNLVSLDLSGNRLSSLPPEIGGLHRLSVLSLHSNELTMVPSTLGTLPNLSHLDLSRNRLENLPAELGELRNLQVFSVIDNPLRDSLAAVADRGTRSLLAYLRSLLRDGTPLYEAKLVLVGEGNVGKSSLLAAMLQKPFVEGRPTTHGIEISPLELLHPAINEKITLNVWDFGGQPVYRISHQFFYSQRSLYIIVWSPREGPDKNDVEGWFERIKLRAGSQAIILVVATHCETGQRIARIDEGYFTRKYGDIIAGFHEIDSQTGRGIEELKAAVARAAAQLPQMGDRLSLKWKEARDKVLALAVPQITRDFFRDICAKHDMREEEIQILACLLHDLGHVVYFNDDESLSKIIVLQPEWLTKAIGFVLEDEATDKSFGVLEHRRLEEIWFNHGIPDRARYDPQYHPFFLRLMEKFDVSYRLEDGHSSLVAQLVPAPAPPLPWTETEEVQTTLTQLKLVCLLSAQPPGLIPWLIVRTHRHTTGRHWLRGMLLDLPPHGEALLELHERELDIVVRGGNPAHFMSILSDTFEHLVRQRWPGLEYRLAVPCPRNTDGTPCTGRLKMDVLIKRRANRHATMSCPDCGDDLDISQLLTGFASPSEDSKSTIETIKGVLTENSKVATEMRLDREDPESVSEPKYIDPSRASWDAQMLRSVLQALREETKHYPPLFTLV
jgi:internalin A